MSTTVVPHYDYIFKEIADPRVEGWTLMNGPGPILGVVSFYLATVYVFLPSFMKNRKPYDLKAVIQFYNIFQIVACLVLIYGIATSGWTTEYTLGCQPPDYTNRPIALRMLNFVYWTFILKIIELVETCFFVLRKKYNQVTKLHVYHHSSTVLLAWIACKYIGGGMATFPIMINCFIHVLMYTYYFLSSIGPEWQKRLEKWKPRLTLAQMIQFCILIAHSMQALSPACNSDGKVLLLLYLPNVALIFHMFWDFYKQSYMKRKKQL